MLPLEPMLVLPEPELKPELPAPMLPPIVRLPKEPFTVEAELENWAKAG